MRWLLALHILAPAAALQLGTLRATSHHARRGGNCIVAAASVPAEAEASLALCRRAAVDKSEDGEAVVEALLQVEMQMRAAAKSDDGALSRATLAALDGAWRLVFTTGTVDMQNKLGRSINYFPIRATQTFDTKSMTLTNGIYAGDFALLKFFGTFDWLEKPRRLEFDFDSIAVLGFKIDLPKGGAEKIGASTGLGSEGNVKRAKSGKKAFFNWISADEQVATARGGGGGLALWRRDVEMEAAMAAGRE